MKKIFTVLLSLFIVTMTLWAQDVDRSYVFVDEHGNEVEDGATIVRNLVQNYDEETEFIDAGLSIKKINAASSDYIKVNYAIEQIDNGTYQICFPMTCNMHSVAGVYETGIGQLMDEVQNIMSEWFPTANGTCVVTLAIEIFTRQGAFPPSYVHKAFGPSVTVQFVKLSGASGDVNGDGSYVQLADGVYFDGTTLYIGSGVTSLGDLQVNPSEIYCYAMIPPACMSNTFTGYGATLHVPAAGMVSYFTALYWYNFNNILSDAIEPLSITMNTADAEVEIGQQMSLLATVVPNNATPGTVYWSSTNSAIATVDDGGAVTAVAEGECDILAKCVDKVAICHVTVIPPQVTITLDKHEARLLPNHTMTLTACCSPIDVELVVTSSNPGVTIPRLVNGTIMVVGVAEGTATITVNAADGNGNPDSCVVTVYTEHGDVNSDGYVNISDVTKLISYVLSGNSEGVDVEKVDINKDGNVNISDVTMLISFVLSGKWPWEHDPNDYVDLGLPSGTLWATCNIGANRPEERGYYFAWGETSPKDIYNWSTYKWCSGSDETLTKYCTNGYYGDNGFTDGKTELDLEDDAAYVNWGPSWRMPTKEQMDELMMSCSWRWTSNYGVQGYQVESGNGRRLFLPAGGMRWNYTIGDVELKGYYWSCTLNLLYNEPSYLYFYSGYIRWGDSCDRSRGLTVRAVRAAQN